VWIVIGAGVLVVVLSAFADRLGLGRSPGFGWRQALGVVVGALIVATGIYLNRGKESP
jgi:uncharacterized membrane protein YedE/YeeE